MPNVSIYPHIKESVNCKVTDLSNIIDNIKSGFWRDRIAVLRQMVADGKSKYEIEEYKNTLPYFTGSGTFSKRLMSDPNFVHSGKLVVDFDKIESYMPISEARKLLIEDKYTEVLFTSCTGTGFAVIVSIDPSNHLNSFLYLEDYYLETYGLKMDKSCKDITRPRYISHDPDLYYNPNAEFVVVPDISEPIMVADMPIKAPVSAPFEMKEMETDQEKYDWCVSVHSRKESYVVGNRHNFLVILAFFLNKVGVSHSYAMAQFLSNYKDKDEKELTRIIKAAYDKIDDHATFKVNSGTKELPKEAQEASKKVFTRAMDVNKAGRQFNTGDINAASKDFNVSYEMAESIFKSVFKNHADAFNLDEKPDIYKVEYYLSKNYDLVKNEVTHRIEYRPRNVKQDYELINVDELSRDLSHKGFKFPLDRLKSLLRSNFVPVYNPFRTYFETLEPWDQENDYIQYLANHVTCKEHDFWRAMFKKALVRMIACSIDLKVNRMIMTLIGEKEETGKSSFINFLCPPKLKNYYSEEMLDTGKDSQIQLSETFLHNLEELASLSAIETNKLKAIISKAKIKARRSYAEFAESNPRRVNFWAATNKVDFLTDDQNTRWLCFEVEDINFDYNNIKTGVRNVDIDKVWAQAWALYRSGFDYRLTREEMEHRAQSNKQYEQSSLEKELILKHYKQAVRPYGKFVSNADLLQELQAHTDNKMTINIYAIARAMKQLEFERSRKNLGGKQIRGYWVDDRTIMDKSDTEIEPPDKLF